MIFNPYKILGVEQGDDLKVIRRAYKKLAQMYHPDKNPDNPHAKTQFKHIKEAWEIINDPDRRARAHKGESTKKYDPRPQALNHLFEALQHQLQNNGADNIIQNIRKLLQQKLAHNKKGLAQGTNNVKNLRACVDKFSYDGSERNIIADAIETQAGKIDEQLLIMTRTTREIEIALKILQDYHDIEALAISYTTFSGTNTSSTT